MTRFFQLLLSVFLLLNLSGYLFAASNANEYTHWQDLPPGTLKQQFESGSQLINNLNIVELENQRPVLIRGGGFTPAGLDWLIKTMGVRTIIDLRGKFGDDKTHQIISHSPSLLAAYRKNHTVSRLENLSPTETAAYVAHLAQEIRQPVHYANLRAEDRKVIALLDAATPQQPLAMFCQYGVNRSGTAWGAMAANRGWTLEQADKAFGIPKPSGGIINARDIAYGYHLRSAQPNDAKFNPVKAK